MHLSRTQLSRLRSPVHLLLPRRRPELALLLKVLDLQQWGPPPWTELQWATLRNVIELAQDAAGLATTGKPTDLHR